MEREVFLVRGDAVVWHGQVAGGDTAMSRFQEAWRRALQAGAVTEADAGIVQFRSYTPDVSVLRRVALRAVAR